jgi:hypothetical protein
MILVVVLGDAPLVGFVFVKSILGSINCTQKRATFELGCVAMGRPTCVGVAYG